MATCIIYIYVIWLTIIYWHPLLCSATKLYLPNSKVLFLEKLNGEWNLVLTNYIFITEEMVILSDGKILVDSMILMWLFLGESPPGKETYSKRNGRCKVAVVLLHHQAKKDFISNMLIWIFFTLGVSQLDVYIYRYNLRQALAFSLKIRDVLHFVVTVLSV